MLEVRLKEMFPEHHPHSVFAPDNAIDTAIRPLVDVLNTHPRFATTSSCAGHGTAPAYIAMMVKGEKGVVDLQSLLIEADRLLTPEGEEFAEYLIEATLDWHPDVATSQDVQAFPGWLAFNITISNLGNEESAMTDEDTDKAVGKFQEAFALIAASGWSPGRGVSRAE
jgi:methyltransferase TYW3-like protein